MSKTQVPDTEAISRLLQSFQKANQAVLESIVVTGQANMHFAHSTVSNWLEALKSIAASSHTLIQEIEAQEQQETFHTLAQEWMECYFALLRAPLSFYPPSLQLTEQLQLCLLALESRYPYYVVDMNEEVLGPQGLGAEGWHAFDLIELFHSTAPQLLHEQGRLVVNAQCKGIYLINRSEDTPALRIHCGIYRLPCTLKRHAPQTTEKN